MGTKQTAQAAISGRKPARRAVATVAPGANPRAAAGEGGMDYGCLPSLLGYNLRRVQSAVFQHFAASIGPHDISPGQFGVLVLVEANPGLSQTALARALNVNRSTIVPVIDRLEAEGLVIRQKKANDRRTHELHLTAHGASRFKILKAAVVKHDQAVAGCLGDSQKKDLIRALANIRDGLATG